MSRILGVFLAIIFCTGFQTGFAQQTGVAINTDGSAPDAKAMLDIKSTDKGILIPRMTTAQRTAINLATKGLLVFDNTTSSFWFHNGTVWTELADGGGGGSHWLASGNNIYNANSGNVGIGTNLPASKFHLAGNMLMNSTNPIIQFQQDGTDKGFIQLSGNNLRLGTNSDNGTGKIVFRAFGNDHVFIDSIGQVGIGKSSPSEKVEVNGNLLLQDGNPFLKFRSSASAIPFVDMGIEYNHNATNLAKIIYDNNALKLIEGAGSQDMVLKDGKVGVNTENPEEHLHVVGNMMLNYLNPTLKFQNSGVDKGFVDLSNNDFRIGTYGSNTTGNFKIRVNGGERMNIDPEGTVHLTGGVDASLASNGYLMIGNPTASNIVFDNNEILARNNGAVSTLVLQNDGGSVRIGNVAVPAGYKFAVNGKMICEELKVQLQGSWPDYVFANQYKLRSIYELEKFIQQNKHLPNVPTASEIEKSGLELGEMQKRMMEKIEELTLYIIELKKEIDTLTSRK